MCFHIHAPNKSKPIVISVPHCGTEFPEDLAPKIKDKFKVHPEDTDWFVDELYRFSQKHSFTLIKARYSRYVIDLNRPVSQNSLYEDGRSETKIVPLTTFLGEPLYEDQKGGDFWREETARRVERYYKPYYEKIESLLSSLQKEHKNVLFFDAHSIKRLVPSIQKEPFPDLILGDRDEVTAAPLLAKVAKKELEKGGYQVSYNKPFKGGNLTKHFGRGIKGVHALQLEKSQDIYMEEKAGTPFLTDKAAKLQTTLERTLLKLADALEELA